MTIFTSLEQAQRHGFYWVEYRPDLELHQVEMVRRRGDGLRERCLAWARARPEQLNPKPSN